LTLGLISARILLFRLCGRNKNGDAVPLASPSKLMDLINEVLDLAIRKCLADPQISKSLIQIFGFIEILHRTSADEKR